MQLSVYNKAMSLFFPVSVSVRYCIPQCVRLIAGGVRGRFGGVHDRLGTTHLPSVWDILLPLA